MEENTNVEELDSTQKIEKVENVPSQFDNIKSRTEMAEMSKEEINSIKEHIKDEQKEESQFIEPTKQTNTKSILFLLLIVLIVAVVFYFFPMIRGIFHK